MFAYNCSPSFNWAQRHGRDGDGAVPARAEGDGLRGNTSSGTLAGFHNLSPGDVRTWPAPMPDGMAAYSSCSRRFAAEPHGLAIRHRREVGPSHSDAVAMTVSEAERHHGDGRFD